VEAQTEILDDLYRLSVSLLLPFLQLVHQSFSFVHNGVSFEEKGDVTVAGCLLAVLDYFESVSFPAIIVLVYFILSVERSSQPSFNDAVHLFQLFKSIFLRLCQFFC
jgi:hypothetical protein